MKKLQNKIAFITGASSEFGKVQVSFLPKKGAHLVLVDLKEDPLVKLKIASNNMKWTLIYRQPVPDDYKGEKADLSL